MPMSVLDQVRERESIIGILRPPPVVRYGRRRSDKVPWAGVVILLVAILLMFFGRALVPVLFGPSVPFELQASDASGQMHIRWNAQADGVVRADRAVLEVKDGKQDLQYPVSRTMLANGGLDYTRKTDDVVASLVLYKDGREIERRIVRSISAPVGR